MRLEVTEMNDKKTRCAWVNREPIYIDYHDKEWGVPLREDQALFELFILESIQDQRSYDRLFLLS